MQQNSGLYIIDKLYQPFASIDKSYLAAASLNMEEIIRHLPEYRDKWETFKASYSDNLNSYLFIPWRARYGVFVVVLNSSTSEYVTVLDIPAPLIPQGFKVK